MDDAGFRRVLLRSVLLLTLLVTGLASVFSLRLTLHAVRVEQARSLAERLASGMPTTGSRHVDVAGLSKLIDRSAAGERVVRGGSGTLHWGYAVGEWPETWAALETDGAVLLVSRPARDLSSADFESAIGRLLVTAAVIAWLGFWGGIALTNKVTAALKKSSQQLVHVATHDALTGLMNRFAFEALGKQGVADGQRRRLASWVVLFDLDGFKDVNDSLGHHRGDVLLCAAARRAEAVVGSLGKLARFGGDEFSVWVQDQTEDVVEDFAWRLHEAMRLPFLLDELEVTIGASVGFADCDGTVGAADCVVHADVAMYASKARRSGPVRYHASLDTRSAELLSLRSDLGAALQKGEITLHYQPKRDLKTGAWCGVEALARWSHPTRGWVSPAVFIDLAERTGMIDELTWYLLDVAARQARRFQAAGLDCPIAVNLSALCFNDADLPELLADWVERARLTPAAFEFELTESQALQDQERAIPMLQRLSVAGFRLALDDFGTGMSSLSYLSQLPVDVVKIDRSFVSRLEIDPDNGSQDSRIVEAIVGLAHQLNKSVTAEGVEDPRTEAYLRSIGCDESQGFGIQRPVDGDTIFELLSRDGPRLEIASQGTPLSAG